MIALIKKYTDGNEIFEFVFIPHSKAYVSAKNNDFLTGQYIWSSCDIYWADRENLITVRQFSNDPIDVLSYYCSLDCLITYRFHGLIFSELSGVPVICGMANIKNSAYINDSTRSDLLINKSSLLNTFIEAKPLIKNRYEKRK